MYHQLETKHQPTASIITNMVRSKLLLQRTDKKLIMNCGTCCLFESSPGMNASEQSDGHVKILELAFDRSYDPSNKIRTAEHLNELHLFMPFILFSVNLCQ